MNWGSAADFWAMGGYGFYVWGSYAALLAVIGIELWLLRARRAEAVHEMRQEVTRSSNPK